ncbi:MAG: hypothetical protein OEY88_07695 [Candidatus Bathyarchaeota archaeon]|nr:hypothetical protein [Candidatus Bathyarchaeota archaeon]
MLGETDTADNLPSDHTVMVIVPSDVNGDGKVRIDNVLAIALAFALDDLNYDSSLDVNNDDRIRVDDILIAALGFGQG